MSFTETVLLLGGTGNQNQGLKGRDEEKENHTLRTSALSCLPPESVAFLNQMVVNHVHPPHRAIHGQTLPEDIPSDLGSGQGGSFPRTHGLLLASTGETQTVGVWFRASNQLGTAYVCGGAGRGELAVRDHSLGQENPPQGPEGVAGGEAAAHSQDPPPSFCSGLPQPITSSERPVSRGGPWQRLGVVMKNNVESAGSISSERMP